jgi:hypothetical protein
MQPLPFLYFPLLTFSCARFPYALSVRHPIVIFVQLSLFNIFYVRIQLCDPRDLCILATLLLFYFTVYLVPLAFRGSPRSIVFT